MALYVVIKKINLEFYIDIHAHSTMMNGFMYGNIFEDEERFQRQAVFPKLLCQNAEDFSYSTFPRNTMWYPLCAVVAKDPDKNLGSCNVGHWISTEKVHKPKSFQSCWERDRVAGN
ncbi:hypothetical protein Q9233_011812 [Columba guinea]|nr:hypothetical protein Q9233_011812 [Columba guinea]